LSLRNDVAKSQQIDVQVGWCKCFCEIGKNREQIGRRLPHGDHPANPKLQSHMVESGIADSHLFELFNTLNGVFLEWF
jgi:hypothetical protein